MTLSEDTQIVERYLHKDINVYEVVTRVTTKIFVGPYAYLKKKRNGELDVVSVEGHVREVIRNYVHFEPAVNIMIGSVPKHNDLVFSGNI
jgi:uridine kinase